MRRTAFLLLTLALLTVPVCAVQLPGELLDALPEEAAALAEGEGITEGGVRLLVQSFFDALRASLRARFVRSKNTAQVRAAIRSQVMVELENKRAQEIIDSFGEVSVKASEDDPTVCLVEFSFAVAHGLNRIYLSAHITV